MGVVDKFNKRIDELEKVIYPTIQRTVNRNKGDIIDQQTDGQMYKGEDSKGMQFVPSYAFSTIQSKKRKGQPTNRVTLKDTGDLYKSINVDAKTTEFIISANVEYFKYLVLHYSNNIILGLKREYLTQFVNTKVLPNLEVEFKKIIKK
jgi:hypothetical protein